MIHSTFLNFVIGSDNFSYNQILQNNVKYFISSEWKLTIKTIDRKMEQNILIFTKTVKLFDALADVCE